MSAFRQDPTNQEILAMLGEVHAEMGDLPAAGRLWLLTDRDNEEIAASLSAFEQRWGGNLGEKLKVIPLRAPIAEYPPPARDRLRALAAEASAANIEWPPNPAQNQRAQEHEEGSSPLYWLTLTAIMVLGPGLWLLGVAITIYLIVTSIT